MVDDLYTLTTPAAEDPLSLDDAKNFLRVDHGADDSIIGSIIKAVTFIGEKFCNRLFVQRTITGLFSEIGASNQESSPFIQVRRAPLVSITSVKSIIDNEWVALDAGDWALKNTPTFPRIRFLENVSADTDASYKLQVIFIAGYGVASVVPDDIKAALKMHINFLYENRGDTDTEGKVNIPRAVEMIYRSGYRILNTFG